MPGVGPKMHEEYNGGPYNYLYDLGASLWIPAKFTSGRHRFIRGSDADLIGTVGGSPLFGSTGRTPGVGGRSPSATFDGNQDKVVCYPARGDDTQMSTGGTFIFVVTPQVPGSYAVFGKKSDPGEVTSSPRQGWSISTRPNANLYFETSDNAGTSTELVAIDGIAFTERVVLIATLDGSGHAEMYNNCDLLATGSGMQMPSNTENSLVIGNSIDNNMQAAGDIEIAATIKEKILDSSQRQNLCRMFGTL